MFYFINIYQKFKKMHSKQIKAGNNYMKLQKTIAILIANFNVNGLESLNYRTSWKIIEEEYRSTILTDKLEIYIIELPKIVNLQNENNELLDWLFFLEDPKSERVIEKMKSNRELKQANKKLEEISQDEHMKKIAEWREKAILEENTARACGYEDGLKKGIELGIEQRTYNLIASMLENDESIDKIQLYSGCSVDKIEKIREELEDKELWDILDENGNITGKTMEKEDKIVWQKGIYHQGADVWIINSDNKILIQKRSFQKKLEPNVWAMTGGSVIKGEKPIETLKRETLEELGIELDVDKAIKINHYKTGNVWLDEYIVKQEINLDNVVMNVEEVSDVKFATFDEIEKLWHDNMFIKNRWEFVREEIKKYTES